MAKKIFFGSLGLLILVLIFLGAYNFAFKNNVNNPLADPLKRQAFDEESESVSSEKIENTLNEKILGPVAGDGSHLYYYSYDDRSLKQANLDGKNKTILLSNLPGTPSRIVWAPKRDKVLLYMKEMSGGTIWYSADLTRKTINPLKAEISRLAWDNLGEKIFYQYTDAKTGMRTMNIANPDGSGWKKIADIGTKEVYIAAVPQSSMLSFWNRPQALDATTLETVSSNGEYRKTLFSGKFGGDFLWSPNGENVLMSAGSQKNSNTLSLYLMKGTGSEPKDLSVPTLVSKAVWSQDGKTLYYALPGNLTDTIVLPNDYFSKPIYTKDTFWKMDTESGKKTRLVNLEETNAGYDSTDLFLSPDEETLYFLDRQSQKLYHISL